MDAGTVAGLAVGIDRAAMPDRLQRIDARLHHVAALLAVECGHQADAARIVLLRRIVGVFQDFRVTRPGGKKFGSGFVAHKNYSAAWARLCA